MIETYLTIVCVYLTNVIVMVSTFPRSEILYIEYCLNQLKRILHEKVNASS